MDYCQCLTPLSLRQGYKDLAEEMGEFMEKPSLDEFSDCTFALGRIAAGLFGKVYFPMPFDGRHKRKILARMVEYGCVRSKRHLRDGKCPSV